MQKHFTVLETLKWQRGKETSVSRIWQRRT